MSDSLPKAAEQALVSRAQAGDTTAYETLARHNADRLFAVVLRFSATEGDAEEATQEAFLRAWRNVGRFRGDARFYTWLYRIGVNEAKRIHERRPTAGTVVSVEDRPIDDVAYASPDAHSRIERASCATCWNRGSGGFPRSTEPQWCCAMSNDSPPRRPLSCSACVRRPSRAACTAGA